MESMTFQLIGFAVLIGLSALFSSAEVAFTGLTYSQIKRIKRSHPGILRLWEISPDRVLATLLLSNNGVNVAVGVLSASFSIHLARLFHWHHSVVTGVVSFVFGLLLLTIGEVLPKILAKRFTVFWVMKVSPFVRVWSRLIEPMSRVAVQITHIVLLGRRRRFPGSPYLRKEELERIFVHSTIPPGSRTILGNLMEFSRMKVGDVMIPQREVFAVSGQEPLSKIIEKVVQSGFSRIPVFSGELDHLIGLIYAKDLLVSWRSGTLILLEDLLRPVHVVDADMPLRELLRIFRSGRHHLAVVVDRTAKTTVKGIISLQDALEAIVGEIKEEA